MLIKFFKRIVAGLALVFLPAAIWVFVAFVPNTVGGFGLYGILWLVGVAITAVLAVRVLAAPENTGRVLLFLAALAVVVVPAAGVLMEIIWDLENEMRYGWGGMAGQL